MLCPGEQHLSEGGYPGDIKVDNINTCMYYLVYKQCVCLLSLQARDQPSGDKSCDQATSHVIR